MIAERPSEHPLGRAILKRGSEESLSTVEPDRFEYVPGEGIVCSAAGEEIVVGNRRLLAERHIVAEDFADDSDPASEVLVARGGRLLGALRFEDVVRPEARQTWRRRAPTSCSSTTTC